MEAISIRGGADGPTSVYTASTMNWPLIVGAGTTVVLAITSLIVWKKKYR